ncbi:2-amino-4,5-dihydroxy-6-oxo-7-(phosphonooxy)heptanoate synthase [Streptomyces sp. RB5]|uniref:2-amino-4, 5-dihydroxy-6-oxo-7-(Phosphonooxy)heptanoate synthase n=1 Tax=Streptomyces smaragdinus TaxID=2585196 RepID=A0A7K0C9E5_9ACTN|nr:bagremycin/ferroverdin biosynthesis DhnA-type aldolase BagB/FevI [Streptomyces smaragdinus]MQY10070.1 2-amino-4,5-dihydroxy-6-oxo-7-(phosphonooxy)heptanoate synthase [Streptomyces smaragdinus]
MIPNGAFGRRLRLRRLYRHHRQRLLVVPLDHAVTQGPITGGEGIDTLVGRLAANRVDAVVLHKGSLRYVDPAWFARTSLIVHLSASTVHAPDPDAKYLVAGVEESLRLGADAVSVHVNLGSDGEQRQIADLAAVADACDRWNVPLLAMMYPRGPKITDPRDPALVAHAVTLAADLGADLVKTPYVGSPAQMKEITSAAPVPVITVGGPRVTDESRLLAQVAEALEGGAAGVAMGRNIFQAPDPGTLAGRLADLIHGG